MHNIRYLLSLLIFKWRRIVANCNEEYYRRKIAFCGEDVRMYPDVSIENPHKIFIGSHSHLGERCHLRGGGNIIIGKWCQIANNVIIATGNHPITGDHYYGNVVCEDVVIGDNVWIASGAIILPGVSVGNNSVVSAGAVVTNSVPDNVIVAGVPARVIGSVPVKNDRKR